MQHKYGKEGLVILSVSLDLAIARDLEEKVTADEMATSVRTFLKKRDATFGALIMDEPMTLLQERLHFSAPPCAFVFNRKGQWTQLSADRNEFDVDKIEKLVVELLRERAAQAALERVEFFETRIRPLLAEHCLGCHGGKKQQAGLRLDSLAGLLKGGENGPIVVKGHPEKSALIRAVDYKGDIRMPPQGVLPRQAIDDLTRWVQMGLPWPNADKTGGTSPPPSNEASPRTPGAGRAGFAD